MATILDVVDNYLTYHREADIARMPGRVLMEMGDEVNRFASTYAVPTPTTEQHPVYIGGWPSANVWNAHTGQLTLLALLYCGQVLAKDPISDWFAMDRYGLERPVSDRQGFLGDDGSPNVAGTRAYLAAVLPGLRLLRPLIESGAILLVPSESYLATQRETVDRLRDTLVSELGSRTEEITTQFHPVDLTVGDNRRGMFVFAGGEREAQLRKAIGLSVANFAREWTLAKGHGVEYAAPFTYERYLCEAGLEAAVARTPGARVVHALWRSRLPVFRGLTPDLVARVRRDDAFASFRAALFETYRDIPSGTDDDLARYFGENEEARLRPILQQAEREAESGFLRRAGITRRGIGWALASALLPAAATGSTVRDALIRAGIALGIEAGRNARSPSPGIWTRLYKHGRLYKDEQANVVERRGENVPVAKPWFIADEPSLNVSVTAGAVLMERSINNPPVQGATYSTGDYRLCECGSGLKFKFCCRGLKGFS